MALTARTRLGILGGTFDPVHIGHLIVAEEARLQLNLSNVLFIPASQPWMRSGQPLSEPNHRMDMVRLAIADNPHFEASEIELSRPGPTYTIDTLIELRSSYGGNVDPFFIVGADSYASFHKWKAPHEILELCTLVVYPRTMQSHGETKALETLPPALRKKTMFLNAPVIDINGTEIRRRVAQGVSIRYWVPREVEDYIHRHGLYRMK